MDVIFALSLWLAVLENPASIEHSYAVTLEVTALKMCFNIFS